MILPVSQAVIAANVGLGFDSQGERLRCLQWRHWRPVKQPAQEVSPFGVMAPGIFAVMTPPETSNWRVRTGIKVA
ncbi:hypothetical protein SBC2_77630 (plasmid) [Caballeronia sp. SBC2]|nr:hypothetical protein SBC2_77630 [Caballeronia sp. SBC2]